MTGTSDPRSTQDVLLTPQQTGELLQVSVKTLANLRWRQAGPPYIKLGDGPGGPIRYSREAVLTWLESRSVSA